MNRDKEAEELLDMLLVCTPGITKLKVVINRFRHKEQNRLFFINFFTFLIVIASIVVWYIYKPEMLLTKIGLVLVVLTMIIYATIANSIVSFPHERDLKGNICEYLKRVCEFELGQQLLYNWILDLIFLLRSAGLSFCIIECVKRHDCLLNICIIALGWVIIQYIYLKIWQIPEQKKEINKVTGILERTMHEINKKPTR